MLFIGDGMGFDHVAGGGMLANGSAGTLRMESMERQGRLRTASLSGLTDSAASATAYASGVKTWNGRLGKDRDGDDVQNVMELARAQGMATGIVTSDDVTGGTPAAFMAHVNSRGDKPGIIEDIMAAKPDILLGGGWRTLELPLQDEGDSVQVLRTRDELLNLVPEDKPIFGVFTDDTLPFVTDDTEDDPPTLAEMATAALRHIEDDPEGYILVVEGARIDHASHGRMGDRVLQEVVDFDNAVAAVLDAVGDEEVTVMVTADHECGGLALTGATVDGVPEVTWRRNDHTNEDVPLFAQGPRTATLHEARWDNRVVHAVMTAVILDQPLVEPPEVAVIDGWLDDVGSRVTDQVHHSDFGHGHNQMDALRLSSDGEGIRVGVDGVFEDRNNIPLVLVDLDFGDGTGLGPSNTLGDEDGTFDTALSALSFDIQVAGLGFDVAIGGFEAQDLRFDSLHDGWGLRGVNTPWMEPGNLFWLKGVLNFDDGNIARDHETARDHGRPRLRRARLGDADSVEHSLRGHAVGGAGHRGLRHHRRPERHHPKQPGSAGLPVLGYPGRHPHPG